MDLTVQGIGFVIAQLNQLRDSVQSQMEEALEREAKRILDVAEPLTPLDTGNLRRSAQVRTVSPPLGFRAEVWAQMGGPAGSGDPDVGEQGTNQEDVFYAWLQHEHTGFKHTWPPSAQAKYLQKALSKRKPFTKTAIKKDIESNFGRRIAEEQLFGPGGTSSGRPF